MATQAILDTLSRLDQAVMAEIEILQEGRFKDLQKVQQETAMALQNLDAVRGHMRLPTVDQAAIERAMVVIRERSMRARSLLASALNGARDAKSRLDGLTTANDKVGAYTANGSQVSMKNFASPYNKTI